MVILSTLIGFLSSALPDIFRFFQDKQDKKHEIVLLEMQMEHAKQGHAQKLAEIELQADIADSKAVGARVKQSLVGIRWIDALSGSVRPIITYLFFAMYAAVKVAQYHLLIEPSMPWQEPVSHAQALVTIWTPDDMALFAAIITFWFGNRTFNKLRGRA